MTDALAEGDEKMRTTLGRMRKMRPAVLASELRLARHEGSLLFPDGLPVARIRLTADHIARRGPATPPAFFSGDPVTILWKPTDGPAPAHRLPSPNPLAHHPTADSIPWFPRLH